MIDLNVTFIKQSFEFDCWYASLRMLVKFRDGANAEPVAHPTAELAGMTQQSKRTAIREEAKRSGDHPMSYGVRKQVERHPKRGLNKDEFAGLAGYNGLAVPLMPPRDTNARTGGFTSDQLESLLRIHGPLWCALGYGHIVVLKGIDAQGRAVVHDPQGKADTLHAIGDFNNQLAWDVDCVMFLPAVPNAEAFNPNPAHQ